MEWTSIIWWDTKVNHLSHNYNPWAEKAPTALKDGDARIASTVRVQPPGNAVNATGIHDYQFPQNIQRLYIELETWFHLR